MSVDFRTSTGVTPITICLAVLLVTVNFSIWIALKKQQEHQRAELIKLQVQSVANDTETTLKSVVDAIDRMAGRWKIQKNVPKEQWEVDAGKYIEAIPGLRAVEWVDNDFIVRWIQPLAGNEAAQDLNLEEEPRRRAGLLAAKAGRRPTITRSVELVQGGQGFLIYAPIFDDDQFTGFILGVMDIEAFLTPIVAQPRNADLWLDIWDGDRRIFSYQTNSKPETQTSPVKALQITQYGATWAFEGGFSVAATQGQGSYLPAVVFGSGMVISSLLLVVLHFAQRARKLNRAIQGEEHLFGLVVEAAPSALLLVSPSGRIEMVNSRAETLFGYSRDELLGRPVEMLVPKASRKHHSTLRAEFVRSPVARPMAYDRSLSGVHRNGEEIPVEIGLNPIETKGGLKILTSIINVSAREKLIGELTRSNQELDDFAYVASHDLKTPLRGVDQLATWLEEDLEGTLDVETNENLRLMRVRINRMENLLDDLLAYSRTGRIESTPESIDTGALIKGTYDLCNHASNFSLHLEGEFPEIIAPKIPLETVFRNLISNAIKHHDKESGRITVRVEQLKSAVYFEVEDDGPGIPVEHTERAFGIFQTLKPRDEVEGSGMGLAIVKKAVEFLDGEVTLRPNSPRGAIFRFSWPTQ